MLKLAQCLLKGESYEQTELIRIRLENWVSETQKTAAGDRISTHLDQCQVFKIESEEVISVKRREGVS